LPSLITTQGWRKNTLLAAGALLFKRSGYHTFPKISYPFIFLARLIALPLGLLLPTYFTLRPFAKVFSFIAKESRKALAAGVDILATCLNLVIDDIPAWGHILYRAACKVVFKTLCTLAQPGKLGDILFDFAKNWPGFGTYFTNWRISPNYGFGVFSHPRDS